MMSLFCSTTWMLVYDVIVLQHNMDAIKAEPNSEDETHPSDIDAQQVDTKQDSSEPFTVVKQDPSEHFTFVEVKCEIEVGRFSEA
jgi:hypothetical protein